MVSYRKVHKVQSHNLTIPQSPKGVVYDILAGKKGGWFYRFGTGKRNDNPIPFEIDGEKYYLTKPAGRGRNIWVNSQFIPVNERDSGRLDITLKSLVEKSYEENFRLRDDLRKNYNSTIITTRILNLDYNSN